MASFKEIVEDTTIIKAIDDLGFAEPTAIQEATIPLGIKGRDVIGQAKTGSGKTFAFGIPLVHELRNLPGPEALILAPTRELCQQITRELQKLTKYNNVLISAIYGGVSINPQIDELQDAKIVVGTPGRILDHLERDTLHTEHIHFFVLDEADRMLDMGFIEDIERIISALPEERQTLLFSATMPEEIKTLASRYMHDPEHVKTQSHVEEHYLPQCYYVVPRDKKFSLLAHLAKQKGWDKALIFCGTRRTAEAVARNLGRHGITADELHGGLTQAKRDRVMERFRKGKTYLLVATDVASRGLDIQNVTHVINYDVPKNPEDYIHRIGRTARAGKSGKAVTLLEDRDFEFFQGVLDLIEQEPKELELPQFRNVGFRRNTDEGYSPRGPSRERPGPRGPRRDSPRRAPRDEAPRYAERAERKPKAASGWKQSHRR